MISQPRLTVYRQERDDLFRRITSQLMHDSRVMAARLFGSLGRGDADELSDLDLWVIVADEHMVEIAASRRAFVASMGEPVLLVEAPQNAPVGGAYLMAYYDAPTAPHQVDWYWQACSQAGVTPNARLLFDRANLPHAEWPAYFTGGENSYEHQPLNIVSFFWAMLMITAKHALRAPWADEMKLLPYILHPFQQTQRLLQPDGPVFALESLPPQPSPHDKLHILRRLADEMKTLQPRVVAHGGMIPERAASSADQYLGMIEEALNDPTREVKK